jgi:hypothetical protein
MTLLPRLSPIAVDMDMAMAVAAVLAASRAMVAITRITFTLWLEVVMMTEAVAALSAAIVLSRINDPLAETPTKTPGSVTCIQVLVLVRCRR